MTKKKDIKSLLAIYVSKFTWYEPPIQQILPVLSGSEESSNYKFNVLIEPSLEKLMEQWLLQYLASEIHYSVLEATLCEHAARMTAMDAATTNADEVIKTLTLYWT